MLEATVIILDNTEFMRNGDYTPSRLDAQSDAVQLLTNAKLNANVENAVSIMTMGGPSPKVMVTLSSDQGKLMHAVSSVPFEGDSVNLKSALQVAQLVLKHRQNGNQHQRIVVFVGSPLGLSKDDCFSLHKNMRKNNIAVDVVSFGAVAENDASLEALLYGEETENAAAIQDGEDGSRLVRVFQGQGSIVENIASSPVVRGVAAANSGDGASGAGFEFGVDPEMDPELAMALKLSMEEEMNRQANQSKQQPEEVAEPADAQMDVDEEDEDALLQQAIAMSMLDQQKPK